MYIDMGFCFLEDSLPNVKRTIESVKDHVRYIFAIDGRYEDYDGMDVSTPEVVEYLRSIPNVLYSSYVGLKEPEKRQKYLDLASKHETDWLLILDSDEYITNETDWGQVESELDYKRFPKPTICTILTLNEKVESRYPKMWYRPEGFEYTKCHNFFRRVDDGSIWKSANGGPPIMSIFSKHNDLLRSEQNRERTEKYQEKLRDYEGPLKAKYRQKAVNYSGVVHKRFNLYDA